MALRPFVSGLLRKLRLTSFSPGFIQPGAPLGAVPTVVQAPILISASPKVGSAITATPGIYTGSPTITRQWFYGDTGVPIGGATGPNYTPVSPDVGHPLKYVEIATNAAGSIASAAATTIAVNAVTFQFSPVTYQGVQVTH